MNRNRILIVLVILGLVISGCAAKNQAARNEAYDGGYSTSVEVPSMAPVAEESYGEQSKDYASTGDSAGGGQMIMMNASLTIAVDDPAQTMTDIQRLAKDMGGFTVYSNLYKSQSMSGAEVPQASVTVRVPADRLDEAIDKIKAMTGDGKRYTLNESVSGQDVTKEYTDLSSRLRNLEEADAKLTEFYENAETTEDALAIYTQKMQVTEQIEVIKGQMKYFEDSVDTSAISVEIRSKETIAPITGPGWQPGGVANKALKALIEFGKGLVNVLIWVAILVIPIALLFGIPIYIIVRGVKRRNLAKKEAAIAKWAKESAETQAPPIPTDEK